MIKECKLKDPEKIIFNENKNNGKSKGYFKLKFIFSDVYIEFESYDNAFKFSHFIEGKYNY